MEKEEPPLGPSAAEGTGKPRRCHFDWISNPDHDSLTPFQKFTVGVDWNTSPLGPMKTWPPQLRHMVLLVFTDPDPAVVYWGDDATIVYNEPYTQLIGLKHPSLQGRDPKIGFAEVWAHFEKLLATQRETAVTVTEANALLLFFRHGFLEETYFTWKFMPIIGDGGFVVGSHATVVETTREVISDRRISNIQTLSRLLSRTKTVKEVWQQLMNVLDQADKDAPLALLYSVTDAPGTSKSESLHEESGKSGPISCILEGCIGIADDRSIALRSLDLKLDQNFLSEPFRRANEELVPVMVPIDQDTQKLLEGIEWRGYAVPSVNFIVCPILFTDTNKVLAFLVIGLNPRRPFDEDYQGYIHLLTRQITTPKVSAIILREEVEKRQRIAGQATLDRERLAQELLESEAKFARVATRAPVGLAILTSRGLTLSANDLWRDLMQPDGDSQQISWEKVLVQGEFEPVSKAWNSLISDREPKTLQTRIKKVWRTPDADADGHVQWTGTYLLLSLYPDLDEHGNISTVMTCITDISELKWSEAQLRRRMDQAIEMESQQQRFMDMVSHEMRNPLSALVGCADEIISSLTDCRSLLTHNEISPTAAVSTDSEPAISNLLSVLDSTLEAANTIIYCAMHQKRIIDDVLTLSRLDSNLLLVSPEPSQPIQLVRKALKMFTAEIKAAQIELEYVEQQSLKTLDVQWTLLDPSRVLQVLINLMTNSIKFTRTEARRYINISIGASLTKPSDSRVEYVQSKINRDQTTKAQWGDGEVIYLAITVTDTGRGMTELERKNLFHLFQQASPKTHVKYGGSGLGLFISLQLVEMQGGAIGVASEAGQGSTFQFYIKTRRTSSPPDIPRDIDFQLLARGDALREACGVGVPGPQEALKLPHRDSVSRDSFAPNCLYILVVEDNLVNQKVVSKQLRQSGHVVNVANHGEEALDFIRRSEYWAGVPGGGERLSVILMDLEMPVMDGLTCVRKIRELQATNKISGHVPVIAVTANARRDQIIDSMRAGIDDVATKPYRIHDMLKKIDELLAKTPTRV